MYALGLGALFVGIWLVDSAVHKRSPIATITAILADPTHLRATLAASNGGIGSGTGSVSQAGPGANPPASGPAAQKAIAFARSQIGKPYKWGATGPDSFDCSGLAQAAYKSAGIALPRTTYQQVLSGVAVNKSDLMPGDLVFPDPGHVGIYTGNGNYINAPHSGTTVQEDPIPGFWRARRVAPVGK